MHSVSRALYIGILLFSMSLTAFSQEEIIFPRKDNGDNMVTPSENERYSWPIVSIGGGATFYTGGVKSPRNLSKFRGARWGINAAVEQRFGKYIGAKLNLFYGLTAGEKHTFTEFNNFQSRLISTDVRFVFHFDHLLGKRHVVAPYIAVGVGYVNFRTKSDLENSEGIKYNLWDDGALRDQAQTGQTNGSPQVLTRDFTYETTVNKSGNTLTFPMEAGLRFKMHDFWDFGMGYTHTFILNRFLPSTTNTKPDNYGYASATIYWYLGQFN
jgi:hypothetical protein